MRPIETVVQRIKVASGENEFPGSDYLQGSIEGSEPFEEIEPFMGFKDWREIPSQVHGSFGAGLNLFWGERLKDAAVKAEIDQYFKEDEE